MSFKKLNLFIVGAARSGTTSLWYCLKENPLVFMPKEMILKEPAFFSRLKKSKFGEWNDYKQLFAMVNKSHRWIGEASTSYLTDPGSAWRIYKYNPQAIIIIILRNPVDRAYSLYNWMVKDGYEYASSFEKALILENERIEKNIPNFYEPEYYYNYLYFHSGLYFKQVNRFKKLFKTNVLIIKFENFSENLQPEYEKICGFLDIKPNCTNDIKKNESRAVISPSIQFILRKMTIFCLLQSDELKRIRSNGNIVEFKQKLWDEYVKNLDLILNAINIGFIQRLKLSYLINKMVHLLYTGKLVLSWDSKEARDSLLNFGLKDKLPPKMKKTTASKLKQKFKSDVLLLSEYTGMDFMDWLV